MKGLAARIEKASGWLLLLLSAAATLPKLFIGFDIDEGYAIAMPYRLLAGDHLFGQMWEIHQTSALLPALLMWPFVKLTGGTEAVALYLRFAALLIHLLMTVLVFFMLRGLSGENRENSWLPVLAGTLVYFNLLPKWLLSTDFSMQQLWGLTLVLFCLYLEERTKKTAVSIATAIALSLTILGYVGMIVLYPALLFCYLVTDKELAVKTRILKAVILTVTCGAAAALFLVYVGTGVSLQTFLKVLPQVFADGTHSLGAADKLALYASQWANVCKQWVVFLAAAGVLCILIRVLETRVFKCASGGETGKSGILFDLTSSVIAVTSLLLVFGKLFGIAMGPFHFQARLLLIVVLLFVLLQRTMLASPHAVFYVKVLLLCAVSFAGILLFSNVGPASSCSYLSPALAFLLFVFLQREEGAENGTAHSKALGAAFLFLLSVLMCKGFYVRYTEYFPADILQKRCAVEAGPQKGIYILPDDFETERLQRETIEKATAGGKSAVLLGTDQILNLSMQGSCICPSTISTPAFDSQWITYFTEYADALPEVLFISKNTIDNTERFFTENPFGKWLAQRYDVAHMEENEKICTVYRNEPVP